MYTADWVKQAIRKEVTGKDASAAWVLAILNKSTPGIEELIAQAMNDWVDSDADPASPTYWMDFAVATKDTIRPASRSPATSSGFWLLDPEVSGGLGEHTVLIPRPDTYPLVERLHYEFGADRYDDDLFTSHPVYLVTRRLADSLRRSKLSGFDLSSDVEVSVDENVRDLEPSWQIPEVEWLKVSGTAGSDDLGLTDDARLAVSEAALRVLRRHSIEHCDMRPFGEA